ncbi:MAG TPA: hypothetical protein VK599_07285 [Streptosporangiaceae bacterium]|jgi:hypothetical protein|nr:hypothetical protein [Streptosporangiaceae bacterium]
MTTTSDGARPCEARNPAAAAPGQDAAAPAPAAPGRLTTRLWLILAIVLIADVLDLMDSTMTNIAAPTIVADIGGG